LGVSLGGDGTWNRRLRGGSWNNNADNAQVANRDNNNNPDNRNNNNGFRLARSSGSVPGWG
jgi:formylglycine-generating enzyme required for sulfatase activity